MMKIVFNVLGVVLSALILGTLERITKRPRLVMFKRPRAWSTTSLNTAIWKPHNDSAWRPSSFR